MTTSGGQSPRWSVYLRRVFRAPDLSPLCGATVQVVDLMVKHCDLNKDSYFIDVGAGLGKPNIHVAQVRAWKPWSSCCLVHHPLALALHARGL